MQLYYDELFSVVIYSYTVFVESHGAEVYKLTKV